MPNQWTLKNQTVRDDTHNAVYHGVTAKEIWYKGQKIWDTLHINFSDATIELALDNSGSMRNDIDVLRYCAKQFCTNILTERRRIGLLSFGTSNDPAAARDWDKSVKTILSFTQDINSLLSALDGLAVERYDCRTPMGKAVEVSHQNLNAAVPVDDKVTKKLLILFSDGNPIDQVNWQQSDVHAKNAAAAAKRDGIYIMTMRLGSNVSNQLMTEMASRPTWAFTSASINDLFDAIYELLGG